MRFFEIKEDLNLKKAGYIDAGHKWGLPGVICPVCKNTWSTVGQEYPTVDLTYVADEELYREPRAEPLNVYKMLQQKIRSGIVTDINVGEIQNCGPLSNGAILSRRIDTAPAYFSCHIGFLKFEINLICSKSATKSTRANFILAALELERIKLQVRYKMNNIA